MSSAVKLLRQFLEMSPQERDGRHVVDGTLTGDVVVLRGMDGDAARLQQLQGIIDEVQPLADGAEMLHCTDRPAEIEAPVAIGGDYIHVNVGVANMPVEEFLTAQLGMIVMTSMSFMRRNSCLISGRPVEDLIRFSSRNSRETVVNIFIQSS